MPRNPKTRCRKSLNSSNARDFFQMSMPSKLAQRGRRYRHASYLRACIGYTDHLSPSKLVWEYVHRLVLWCYVGPPRGEIDDSITLNVCMHICSNPLCLNPRHLYWGDRASNAKAEVPEVHVHRTHIDTVRSVHDRIMLCSDPLRTKETESMDPSVA
jgi:hypothetical protein